MDTVFTPASTQEMVFNAANDLIVSVIDGYNVCIFAYGQVWQMQYYQPYSISCNVFRRDLVRHSQWRGLRPILVSTDEPSSASSRYFIHVSISHVYTEFNIYCQVCEERRVDWSYSIEVSVLEIYNEIIRDLLGPNIKTGLEIRHGKAGPYAEGLSTHRVC